MFSVQQDTAAKNIIDSYIDKNIRYAILMSKCQAGKTGAYNAIIAQMLDSNFIDRAYILCGSHETELRDQAKDDAEVYHGEDDVHDGKVVVLFRQDFYGKDMDIRRALIVVDESHLDQGKGQQLDRFLKRHGITMDGNPHTLESNNTYILSVDATPYSEIAALIHKETPYPKHVEQLMPGEGYIGLDYYIFNALLLSTFDLTTTQGARRFERMVRERGNKYALMRLSSGYKGRVNAQEAALRNICAMHHNRFRVLEYTANREDISISDLKHAPSVPTIVIIRGRLRAGKVVPKKHISFVWEGAVTSKTDALVQGLAGRMCGYVGNADEPNKLDIDNLPLLFVPASSLERHDTKVIKESEMERAIMTPDILPTKATNLKKGHLASIGVAGRTQCSPLRISTRSASAELDEYHPMDDPHATDYDRKEFCIGYLQANLNLIRESNLLSPEQKEEILARIESIPSHIEDPIARRAAIGATHIRNLVGNSQLTYYNELKSAHQNGTTPAEHISDCPHMTFVVIHPGYRGVGAHQYHFYVVLYTDAGAGMEYIRSTHLASRIPKTTGKSIFSISDSATSEPLVAAGATGFCSANLATPAAFETALRQYLTHWMTSTLTVSCEIQSVGARFSLDKAAFHYTNSKNNDIEQICRRVEHDFDIELRTKYARCSAGADGHFNLKSISW
jgi:hypothetical protein